MQVVLLGLSKTLGDVGGGDRGCEGLRGGRAREAETEVKVKVKATERQVSLDFPPNARLALAHAFPPFQ